mmetsp:Transcript_42105/g.90431  ORF Transcript_42105/g.90431 Transcript_42105/m.90431 type:complete len:1220 (-) Transcript_42105:205-3864(-)
MGELRRGKTIEQIYQKKTQLEHILLRPDTYIGSIEHQQDKLWVWDDKKNKMVWRDVKFVPGLFKIFDEIMVNAADNYQRDPEGMTYIKVCINVEEGFISIENNGLTLPVEIHKEHKMYVPEMVFGHLLTSDNYDDGEQKVTGGRNGYGAKLTNIFSRTFTVECADGNRGQKYVQTWEKNMGTKNKAKITKHSGKDYTRITFYPDLQRFGMKNLEKDIVSLMKKRVYDAAGSTNKKCKVYLNDELIPVKEFKDYVDLYLDNPEQPKVYEKCGDRWEYVITLSDGQFSQVSFVNSINTTKGGTHVMHVADQFIDAIHKKANSKNKGGMEIKPYHVRNHLWVFVNCLIVNPAFDSQTKETMTLKASKFGSKCDVSEATIKKVLNTGIVDTVLQWAKAKESIDMKKKMKGSGGTTRILGIPKLEDANWAGGKNSEECTLILTEGDSAKALAVAGLSVVGRDRFGVFPLRGKPLNVRDASFQQTANNAEIQNIIKIMGLDLKREYDSVKGLRYGSIMVMADQDFDGSHIKGLLINMFQHWWPSLFKMPGFVQEFITPIVKVTKRQQEIQFFTVSEYEKWKRENQNGKGWSIKYYKGLGTSTSAEGKEYFRHIDEHRMVFKYGSQNDEDAIDLAFNKKRADDRKDWINGYVDGETVDHTKSAVSYLDFVNKELVCFSKYDVMRSIPCMVDGFKPTQRKVLFCCFKRNLKSDVKVAQLAGYISEHSAYHHGEMSLQGTIVGMAQRFVGSNNLNLLVPSGQFGTRIQGGKDCASARYIYTRLERIARVLFHPDDDPILEYQNEEGQSIEPKWYIPVIPMAMVNGAEGIGTGWSTSMPNYSPRSIIDALRRFLKGEDVGDDFCPWYKGFRGSIRLTESIEKNGFEVIGVARRTSPNTIEVTELPIRKWTQDYKEFLTKLLENDGSGKGKIDDFKEYHTENTVHFKLTGSAQQLNALEHEGLDKALKLRSSISTNNLVFFDSEGRIKKYETEREVLLDFAKLRLEYYQKRKDFHVDRLRREKELIDAKVRFILMVIKGELVVNNRKKKELVDDLKRHNFKTFQQIFRKPGGPNGAAAAAEAEAEGAAEEKDDGTNERAGYNYLLGMPLWSLTWERVEDLKKQLKEKTDEYEVLVNTTIQTLWERDLDAVIVELDAIEALDAQVLKEERKLRASTEAASAAHSAGRRSAAMAGLQGGGRAKARKGMVVRKRALNAVDDEEDEEPVNKKAR